MPSTVDELTLLHPLHEKAISLDDGVPFGPEAPDWTYPETLDPDFFSPNISGAQRMPNGNTLICEGNPGHLFEITSETGHRLGICHGLQPIRRRQPRRQPVWQQHVRAYRYAPDYPALAGRDHDPGPRGRKQPPAVGLRTLPGAGRHHDPRRAAIRTWPSASVEPRLATLDVDRCTPGACTLRDATGRLIRTFPTWPGNIDSPSPTFPGLYHLTLCDAEGRPLGTPRRILIAH